MFRVIEFIIKIMDADIDFIVSYAAPYFIEDSYFREYFYILAFVNVDGHLLKALSIKLETTPDPSCSSQYSN